LATSSPEAVSKKRQPPADWEILVTALRRADLARANRPDLSRRYGVAPGTVTYGVWQCSGTQYQRPGVTTPFEQELNRLVIEVR
jgi:hypothetical protein